MVPLILEPLLLRGNDENLVVITLQNKVFHNKTVVDKYELAVVITLQNKVFHNIPLRSWRTVRVVITLQNKVFHNT